MVAHDENMVIGHGEKMPWHMTDDFKKNFVPKSSGCPLIMGGNTARSFPTGKPLPNRPNIVISQDKSLQEKGFIIVDTMWEALAIAQQATGDTIWIIGGGMIYRLALELIVIKEIHVTKIWNSYPGENLVKFCGFHYSQYSLDPSRLLEFKKRAPGTEGEKDRGNSDDAIVEVYVYSPYN